MIYEYVIEGLTLMLQSEQLFLRFYLTTPLRPPPVVVFDSVTMSVKKIVDSRVQNVWETTILIQKHPNVFPYQ